MDFERSKIGDEVITAPQTTWVDVVAKEHTWDGLSTHGLNPRIWLGHKVHQAPTWDLLSFEATLLVSSVVSGLPTDNRDVGREAKALARWGPERSGIKSRLDDSATSTFSGPSDTIFGDAVRLRHPRGGSSQPPFQCRCRGYKLGRIVTIEARYRVLRTCKVLHSGDRVEGGLRRGGRS